MTIHDPASPYVHVYEQPSSGQYRAVIENNSDKHIVGMAAIWINPTLTTATGTPRRIQQYTDSFMLPGPIRPVVATRSRSFLAPGSVMSESIIKSGAGYLGAVQHPDAHVPGWDLTFDAILFSDGELVGPDTLRLKETIAVRKAMATKVTTAVRKAAADRADLANVFAELTATPSFDNRPPSVEALMEFNEIRRIVGELRRLQNDPVGFDGKLKFLEALPEPVKIFRAGE